ncbi:ABC transporter, ATP-binding protein [Sulfurimonas gotlandica GD1]|uniref:ABC transporter, ATP-binding protein n=1 Tax=Sulfurimonas gotlandica (strain DSM 19862 / JCM 16533 / GD1) TaxID=929558 RepID=H1FSH9_SULGG|nr:ABC transporter ATP-binding protein [Sulfurimonas gotlandica]EHP29907.1 ABC transporter, ATP-binding protein [Sulfurimonas gotlandica GD1]
MIRISNISKSYADIKALDNLSLEIKEGTIFGLLGVNGAGKTTLLSILNGLVEIDSGDVEIFGLNLKNQKREIKQISSIIPQHLAFYENLTVKENLDFFADIQNAKKEDYNKAVEINSLENFLKQRAATLSGGQKRRLNIAIGLLNNPKIIYFDEPTVGLDPKSRNEILDSIKEYKKLGITVIYTSHYMAEIEKICDEVAIINHGQLVEQNTLDNLLSNKTSDKITIEIISKDSSFIQTSEDKLFDTLNLLKKQKVAIKQIRYGSTNLEKHFLDITGFENA